MRMVIRLALTGEILYERDSVAGEEMRVWELKQHFCIAISSDAYFAWQLCDDYGPLQDHHLVANVAKNVNTELSLLAINRRLRPPTLDETADILYYVSIRHRRKLWKVVSQGIEVKSVAGKSDKICTLVRAIEANYVEMSRITASRTQYKHSYGPSVILTNVAQTRDFRSAKRYGQEMTAQLNNCCKLRLTLYLQKKNRRHP